MASMSPEVLGLLLLAAIIHALWNLLAKRSLDKQAFIWLVYIASALLVAPALLFYNLAWPLDAWLILLASAAAEAAYCLALARAYTQADYSLVYPIARGTAPPLIALWAGLFLGERPTCGAGLGIALVVVGIAIAGRTAGLRGQGNTGGRWSGVAAALLVSLFISFYTTLDKAAMRLVPPPPYIALMFAAASLMLLPVYRQRLAVVRQEWQHNWWRVLTVAVMLVGGYYLVLVAMGSTNVGYVGAVREVSVVLAALLGWWLLKEPFGAWRTLAAGFMFIGVGLIAVLG
ncbi:MAG: EamA family transporter [Chloroflexota bacterium]